MYIQVSYLALVAIVPELDFNQYVRTYEVQGSGIAHVQKRHTHKIQLCQYGLSLLECIVK